jgi:hypothetical protein
MSCTWLPAATFPDVVPVDLNAASPNVYVGQLLEAKPPAISNVNVFVDLVIAFT